MNLGSALNVVRETMDSQPTAFDVGIPMKPLSRYRENWLQKVLRKRENNKKTYLVLCICHPWHYRRRYVFVFDRGIAAA